MEKFVKNLKGRSTDPVLALYADTSFIIWIA